MSAGPTASIVLAFGIIMSASALGQEDPAVCPPMAHAPAWGYPCALVRTGTSCDALFRQWDVHHVIAEIDLDGDGTNELLLGVSPSGGQSGRSCGTAPRGFHLFEILEDEFLRFAVAREGVDHRWS